MSPTHQLEVMLAPVYMEVVLMFRELPLGVELSLVKIDEI
jgi:hypothetical protein